ncbi:hypothetical protein EZV62_025084 [Acer yangbiense]|uniref:Protein kinase domain-containing protein n=1 Tax=Acer yangbiense TaxID=1000413 RepID=A0A5C7GXF6_9ROSI|nr:hypothetical protein EZV62_025084 [Acer yangbiense]
MKKLTKTTKSAILKRRSYMKKWQQKFRSSSSSSMNECKQFLGKGSFGSVYFVRRKPSNTDGFPAEMAVKTAKLSEASTLKYEKQLLSKYLAASPYVIRCYGDQETEEEEDFDEYSSNAVINNNGQKIYNLFLEFCSGGSLNDHIKKSVNGLLPWQVRSFTRDIVRGLVYIHSQGIVHCDIKPDNILLVPAGMDHDGSFVAKLADFGLAKNLLVEDEESPCLIGSCRYMSPELVKDKLLTFTADIWALGCVVVEMMSGKPAWGYGLGREELLNRIGYSSQVPETPNNVSDDAKDFVSRCFNRSDILRWSAQELLRHPFLAEDEYDEADFFCGDL